MRQFSALVKVSPWFCAENSACFAASALSGVPAMLAVLRYAQRSKGLARQDKTRDASATAGKGKFMNLRSLSAAFLILSLPVLASASAPAPTIVTPDQTQWTAAANMGSGVEMAVLFGNPAASGPFVLRLRLQDGTKFPPHYHNDTERVTVISGTLLVGLGDTMNESQMTALPAGSFVSIPVGVHHYAMTRGVTVIQIDGNGPFEMTPVKP